MLLAGNVEKEYVRNLFDGIAFRYDLLNHLLSGGVDFFWRRRAVEHLRGVRPRTILDVATGTADFAIAALRLKPDRVVGVDIAQNMLEHGRAKLVRRKLDGIITLQAGEAEHLPFPTDSFDAAIVAFGARNFENLQQGLSEMHRVIRRGGKIVVLEFSRPRVFPFSMVYFFYFKHLLPLIGRIVSNHRYAYRYLPETVLKFPEGDDFLRILNGIGFTELREERLTFGIATVYSGTKT